MSRDSYVAAPRDTKQGSVTWLWKLGAASWRGLYVLEDEGKEKARQEGEKTMQLVTSREQTVKGW